MYAAVSVLIAAVNRDSNDADVSDDMPLLLAYVVPVSCTRLPPEMSEEWLPSSSFQLMRNSCTGTSHLAPSIQYRYHYLPDLYLDSSKSEQTRLKAIRWLE